MHLAGLKLCTDREMKPDGARYYRHQSLKKPFLLGVDLLAQMAEKCRFLLKPGEIKPIPILNMARARHYRLYNACFEEYLMAENYYFAYVHTKKPEHLDCLIAVLYRRPWHRWDAGKIKQRAKQFSKLDEVTKNIVFMWYIGFRGYIPKRCPKLFSGKKSSKPFDPREYINGMVHQLTNGNIINKQKLLKLPAMDALDELEQRAVEAEAQKPK